MRSLIVLGAAARLVAASPAASLINLDAITSAVAPSISGPPLLATVQTGIYNAAAASSSVVAAVTAVATAAASTSDAASSKRGLEERAFCLFGFCIGGSSSSSSDKDKDCTTTSTSTTAKPTTTSTTSSSVKGCSATTSSSAAITSAPSSTTINTSTVVPSTCTPISWTNTNAFITTDTACPTPYEVGTYCGFINPEDPCAIQPLGSGPAIVPDTVTAFTDSLVLHTLARTAGSVSGYTQTFKDLNASVNANSYMGLYTMTSYDVNKCASYCDSASLCTGFNVYIERDPAWNPTGCSCTDPVSVTNFKCTIWGSGVQASAATNFGQTRDSFQVVIAGSNGYEKTNTTTPVTPTGCSKPSKCSGVHDHSRTCIGEKIFKGVYDVNLCATYATAQNAVNTKAGLLNTFLSYFGYSSAKCNFFNAFMLTENGKAVGTYCKLFSQQYDASVATSIPGWLNGKYYGVESSWSYCMN